MDLASTTRPMTDTNEQPSERNPLLDQLATQFQAVKDALDRLVVSRSEKTPETRILEHVYFGTSMFQRDDTLKPADEATFRWFMEGASAKDDGSAALRDSRMREWKEASQGLHIGAQKVEAASRFQEWLRSGSGIFHVSGKAGSGKSTLMKLILSTKRTHELLREWAGDKRLLFARFYFWSAGDQTQNSLEGLQRSILFEILLQRPDLVKEVFHEAYPVVARSSWDSPTHSRLFTTASFEKAFGRLLLLPADPRYRICLFIDGLDEYDANGTLGSLPEIQREELAESLVRWTRNKGVKILASSRPYPEFTGTFAEDQRIHLHRLTYDDMVRFGHRMFERHRTFGLPGVKKGYQSLVEEVAHASGGVFLWTGLTIQRMLVSLTRGDSFDTLESQLNDTPRDLNALYEKMFSAIDQHGRRVAMKMMLLVSEEQKYLGRLSHPRGVNAMAISWLELLEDPKFPANQPFLVYTDDEIEAKRQFADSRVNGYTGGLLEVITHLPETSNHFSWPPYLRHTVQFFHRTALEYVAASSFARDVRSSSPNLFNLKFYVRLSLAELHFGSLHETRGGIQPFERYLGILRKYFSTPNPSSFLIEGYKAAFNQQAKYFAFRNCHITLNGLNLFTQMSGGTAIASFDHWVANGVEATYVIQYLTQRVQAVLDFLRPQGGLSFLLSVACSPPAARAFFPRLDRVKSVLALGADLHHSICLRLEGREEIRASIQLSVWQAWCLYYVTGKLHYWGRPHSGRRQQVLVKSLRSRDQIANNTRRKMILK